MTTQRKDLRATEREIADILLAANRLRRGEMSHIPLPPWAKGTTIIDKARHIINRLINDGESIPGYDLRPDVMAETYFMLSDGGRTLVVYRARKTED